MKDLSKDVARVQEGIVVLIVIRFVLNWSHVDHLAYGVIVDMLLQAKANLLYDFGCIPFFNPVAGSKDIVAQFTEFQLLSEHSNAADQPTQIVELRFFVVLIRRRDLHVFMLQVAEQTRTQLDDTFACV